MPFVDPVATRGEITIGRSSSEHWPFILIDGKANTAVEMSPDQLAWLIHTAGPAALHAHSRHTEGDPA